MSLLKVFVSHSHEDDDFCRTLVQALRSAGADVWYDEHNMGSGRLGPTIERELRERPIFVVILSPAALSSKWVEDETRWAYSLLRKDSSRVIQPVTAATIRADDIWLFLQDFKRIETSGCKPYPVDEAAIRLLRTLALPAASAPTAPIPPPTGASSTSIPLPTGARPTPPLPLTGERPTPVAPELAKNLDDLLSRAHALWPRKQAEALSLIQFATQLVPNSIHAWAYLGWHLNACGRYEEALAAYEHALALEPRYVDNWRPLTVDNWRPPTAENWRWKGIVLRNLMRYEEALAAFDRALPLYQFPDATSIWSDKAAVLRSLGRTAEAEVAEQRAIEPFTRMEEAFRSGRNNHRGGFPGR